MRRLGCFLIAFVCGGSLLAQPAQPASDPATAIASQFIETVTKAWEGRDGRAYAAAFWPDAEIVNVFGGVMDGQEIIASRMDQILKGALNARESKQSLRKVRLLAPNVIVVDTTNTDATSGAGVETRFKYILEKRGDVWRAVAGQNTRVSKPTF